MSLDDELREQVERTRRGGEPKYHEKNAAKGKLFARERIARLVDRDSFVEDGTLANCAAGNLPSDGVIAGVGRMGGRVVALMANDSTVKAGSWGRRTVEKILRVQETSRRLSCPLLYLVDSAGARITDQLEMFPGRRGAGRIFYNQVQLSGHVPQLCVLFGPSAAGGAYIPAFCDVVIMVENNASMYLGSPRMAEMVIGEKTTLEEMGGAAMHCGVSGCGDLLASNESEALLLARQYLGYMPAHSGCAPAPLEPRAPASHADLEALIPQDENKAFDMMEVLHTLVDGDSWFEIKPLFAPEILTGFARIEGRTVGIVANQPKRMGGVLFVDSADKAARFIWLCDAYNVPLVFLADVPGFMIGTKVEREGIIRAGAKMISAVSEATVPKLSVIVRKAYGAGLYAMCGPAFEPDACVALPQASIAVMGPQAAVNAVYYNKLQEIEDPNERKAQVERLRTEYRESVDIHKLASELVVDELVAGRDLRREVAQRLSLRPASVAGNRLGKKHLIPPM
ncbi:MAG: acyl-CoA carboxylase subunit beta [Proteobacteria bacterium]|nr:acyl-CoA carboxylase subunit beta [Pseudomonadota bacterium]